MSNPGVRPIEMRGPALVFGGAYSNVQALRAVLAFARAREIRVASDFHRRSCRLWRRRRGLRRSGARQRHHRDPRQLRGKSRRRRGGLRLRFRAGDRRATRSRRPGMAMRWRNSTRRGAPWLAALPPRVDLEIAGLRLAVLHGAPSGVSTFVFPSGPTRVKASELALLDGAMGAHVDGVIVGHSGLPFTQSVEGRLWQDPVRSGMPANDGTPRVWCSVLVPGGRRWKSASSMWRSTTITPAWPGRCARPGCPRPTPARSKPG